MILGREGKPCASVSPLFFDSSNYWRIFRTQDLYCISKHQSFYECTSIGRNSLFICYSDLYCKYQFWCHVLCCWWNPRLANRFENYLADGLLLRVDGGRIVQGIFSVIVEKPFQGFAIAGLRVLQIYKQGDRGAHSRSLGVNHWFMP